MGCDLNSEETTRNKTRSGMKVKGSHRVLKGVETLVKLAKQDWMDSKSRRRRLELVWFSPFYEMRACLVYVSLLHRKVRSNFVRVGPQETDDGG